MKPVTMQVLIATGVTLCGASTASAQQSNPLNPSVQEIRQMQRDNLKNHDYDRQRDEVREKNPQTKAADGRELKLSRQEREAVATIDAALAEKDYEEAGKVIARALGKADTADAKYTFAALQLQLGYATQDPALQDRAVDVALASGVAPLSLLPQLYQHQGVSALEAGDYAKANAAFSRLVELTPTSAEAVMLLGETKNRSKAPAEALPLFKKAVELKKAAGEPVPTAWTRVIDSLSTGGQAGTAKQQ